MRATEATRDRAWGYPWLSRSGVERHAHTTWARTRQSNLAANCAPHQTATSPSRPRLKPSAGSAGAADRQDRPFDGIDRVAATALDLKISRRNGLDRPADSFGIPTAELPASLVDLPRRHGEGLGQL